MRRYRNQIVLSLAFMAVVLVLVVLLSNAHQLADKLGDFPLLLFIPIIGLKVINWILRYLEWHYFLHIIDVYPVLRGETRPAPAPDQPATIRVQDSFILWMASLPFALSPGKIAEVLKALILKSMTQTPVSRSAPIIFAERLVDGIAVVLLVGISAAVAGDSLFAAEDVSADYIRAILIGAVVFMLLLIGIIQFRSSATHLITQLGRLPLIGRLEPSIHALYESSYDLAKIRHLAPTTFFGIGAYFTDCIGFYLMLVGLGETPSGDLFVQATFILGFSVVISALSALPGGAGGREITVGALLKGVVGMGGAATGAAVLLISFFQVWIGVLVGLLVILIFRKRLFPPSLEAEIEAYHREAAPAI